MLLKAPTIYNIAKLVESVQADEKQKNFKSNYETIKKFLDVKSPKHLDVERVLKSLKDIPAMTDNRIVKMLGAGAFGIVFLLNNSKVLKIFTGGTGGFKQDKFGGEGSGEKDFELFKKIYDDQFEGRGSVSTPAIYDVGKVGGTYYVIMNYLFPLVDYLGIRGNKEARKSMKILIKLIPYLFHDVIVKMKKEKLGLTEEEDATATVGEPDFKGFTALQDISIPTQPDKPSLVPASPETAKDIRMLSLQYDEIIEAFKEFGVDRIIERIIKEHGANLLGEEEMKKLLKSWASAFVSAKRSVLDVQHAGNIGVDLRTGAYVMFDV